MTGRSRHMLTALVAAPAVLALVLAGESSVATASTEPAMTAPAKASASSTLLPAGYLSTRGSQIVAGGRPVRIDAIATFGFNWLDQNTFNYQTSPLNLDGNLRTMKSAGFNTLTIGWNDASLHDSHAGEYLAGIETVVRAAGRFGLKVILNHHDDEGVPGTTPGTDCNSADLNGLWYDVGPGTDGTDGCGDPGTVSQAVFAADWEELATVFSGNPTVVGFDLDNEPEAYSGKSTWGTGGPRDIHRMYSNVGSALEAIDPGVLIICEGPQNYGGNFANLDGVVTPEGDLTLAGADPVTLTVRGRPVSDKVVYSVHEYPAAIAGFQPDSGPGAVARYNTVWGYLVTDHIAPVWIGESGLVPFTTADEQAWATTFTAYVNGQDGAAGGPVFKANQQGVSTTWYAWAVEDPYPGGAITATGALVPAVRAVYSQWQLNLARQR